MGSYVCLDQSNNIKIKNSWHLVLFVGLGSLAGTGKGSPTWMSGGGCGHWETGLGVGVANGLQVAAGAGVGVVRSGAGMGLVCLRGKLAQQRCPVRPDSLRCSLGVCSHTVHKPGPTAPVLQCSPAQPARHHRTQSQVATNNRKPRDNAFIFASVGRVRGRQRHHWGRGRVH